jgi:predicted DNA-binding protein (UPF0251 family)
MSPRPKRLRRVSNPPVISGFRPYGGKLPEGKEGSVFLHFEEYEVLRLCDFEMLNHHQAAIVMDVSRSTLTRIYAKARMKVAEALVTGKQIIIEGGKVYFDSDWYSCLSCGCYFNQPDKEELISVCPLCGSRSVDNCADGPEDLTDHRSRCEDMCICLKCGYSKDHIPGIQCKNEICPDCGFHLVRKGMARGRNH